MGAEWKLISIAGVKRLVAGGVCMVGGGGWVGRVRGLLWVGLGGEEGGGSIV